MYRVPQPLAHRVPAGWPHSNLTLQGPSRDLLIGLREEYAVKRVHEWTAARPVEHE
jgi:hypothetical protein